MTDKKKAEAAILDLLDDLDNSNIETFENLPSKPKGISAQETSLENYKKSLSKVSRREEALITIATDRCKPWNHADRYDFEMGDIDALALSISQHGQQEPALIRPSKNSDDGKEYEIIFGNRRWQACSKINIPLQAIVKSLSDQEAAIAQQEENKNREDISDFSRAMHYKSLLDANVFSSIKELATQMGIGRATLTDLLSYTRIPSQIIKEFNAPHKISKKMAAKIVALTSSGDKDTINAIIKLAPEIMSGKISLRQLEHRTQQLINKEEIIYKSSEKNFFKHKNKLLFSCYTDEFGNKKILIENTILQLCKGQKIEEIIQQHLEEFIT